MSSLYSKLIKDKIPVIFDGAFGTQVQKAALSSSDFDGHDGCNEILNLTRPDIVRKIHDEYISAGASVIETNTFGASRPKLREKGLDGKAYDINRTGAVLARRAAEGRPCCVCGALGPTGFLPSSKEKSLGEISFDALADVFEEQAGALLDGGVDLLLLETGQDLLEVRAALYGIRRLLKKRNHYMPLQVQVTMDANGLMLLGSDIHAFLGAVVPMGADTIGFNCGTGPEQMAPHIEKLLALTDLPVAMQPNAGMPENTGGTAVYTMEPSVFAGFVAPLVTDKGLAVVGGCCGTTPDHIRELGRRLAGKRTAVRTAVRTHCYCATGLSGVDLETAARPVIIGERLNTQGSKKAKELVLTRNWDGMSELALKQARNDSTLLDICVAVNEREDEEEAMKTLVSFLADRLAVPFSLDTTAPLVMEAALKVCPGSALLNSINLEKGGRRARNVLSLARDFGCPVIALTMDDEGMAKTVERKLECARRLLDLACGEFGLPEHCLYIDPLVFTLATGDEETAGAAAESLKALRHIKKEIPGARTIMGVSNVSYGFSPTARRVLNNMMLHYAAECGLDAAIFNPLHRDDVNAYEPAVRTLGEALLLNRSPSALQDFVRYFEGTAARGRGAEEKKNGRERTLSPAEGLRRAIIDRDRRALSWALPELLKQKSAAEVLDEVLLPAMAEVGERMASGATILPFVLQAAEVMREAVSLLEPHLKGAAVRTKGKIIMATVFGDVHDIGKNLVVSILRNQGFEMIDLGKQVSTAAIVKAAREHAPDALGLSALLVSTSREMGECVGELARQGMEVPVIIGGAAVNHDFAARIAKLDDGSVYRGNVYYGRDAFEAARIIERIKQGGTGEGERPDTKTPVSGRGEAVAPEPLVYGAVLTPPFYGTGAVLRWDGGQLLDRIDKKRLFKGWWGGGRLGGKEYETAVVKDFTPAFDGLRGVLEKETLIDAAGLYGFFPVITDDARVVLLDPSDFHTELTSFLLPRMPGKNNRSIADYLRPEGDLLAVQAVTAGEKISGRAGDCFSNDGRYSLGFFLNGLGACLTEMLADLVTDEIRRGLGLPQGSGRRYSFGYPGMPSLVEQAKLFEMMAITERLGITLTDRFQMVPEHSTLGIYIYHPEAEYLT